MSDTSDSCLIDLASRWNGASVVAASDESFGEKESLLDPAPAISDPGRYGHRGEIVDGWETRRRRSPGHDWVIIRLGTPGVIDSVEVDTSNFTGNHPQYCSIEATGRERYPSPDELSGPDTTWHEIVSPSKLDGDSRTVLKVSDVRRFTHLRLSVHPDGGVARLRVKGTVVPDPRTYDGLTVDLAGVEHGSVVVQATDGFYSSAQVLNRPGGARSMGEGWETRRRRDGGHDSVVISFGIAGWIDRLVIDTAWYRYNASAEIAAAVAPSGVRPALRSPAWTELLGRTALQPDTCHLFSTQCRSPVGYLCVDAFPDGGLSRIRALGRIEPEERKRVGRLWYASLPDDHARQVLTDAGMSPADAARRVGQQPLSPEVARLVEGPAFVG